MAKVVLAGFLFLTGVFSSFGKCHERTLAPRPVGGSPSIVAGTATGSISACEGTASASPNLQQFTVTADNLTANISAVAPAGFELSLSPGSGYGPFLTITETAGTVNTTVYVRTAATAPAGNLAGSVSLASTGVTTQIVAVAATVNALPTVNMVPSQAVYNGTPTTAINFTGTAGIFTWTNDTPSIGLASGGTGNITAFKAVNTGSSPVIATITVTPESTNPAVTCSGAPIKFSITVKPTTPTINVSATTGYISGCDGTPSASPNIEHFTASGVFLTGNITASCSSGFEVSLSQGSGYASSITINETGGTLNNTVVYVRSSAGAAPGNLSGDVTLSSPGAESTNASVNGTVAVDVRPSVSITTPSNNVCMGVPVTFTASPINGGNAPVYQWQVNGVNAGSNSTMFTTSTLNNGDQVTCTMTSNAMCAVPVTSSTSPIVMSVYAVAPPTVTIAASANNVCAGTQVTFTATPANAGSAPAYQWLVNGSNAGTNSPTFISSSLANGDVVNCVVTGNSPCATSSTAASNNITMVVIPVAAPSVSITASASNICAGTVVTFTATPINGGNSPVFQWLVNGNNAGAGTAIFTSSSLANGDQVSCMMTGNAPCGAPAGASSNIISMSVIQPATPAVSIAASATSICGGSPVTFTAMAVNGGAAPAYQWQVNGNAAGTNNPVFTTSALNNGDVVTCFVISNAMCSVSTSALSNSITIAVMPSVAPAVSITASANNVCEGTPITFTATSVNGGAAPVYQWFHNGNNTGLGGPTITGSDFSDGDQITCIMTSSAACAVPVAVNSNSVTLELNAAPAVNAGGNKTITQGGGIVLNATASGNISQVSWSPATGLSSSTTLNPVANPTVTTTYTLNVLSTDGCTATDSVTITVLLPLTIPNAFTPNGDGVNDVWDIKNIGDYKNSFVEVFDRYGQQVLQQRGNFTPWDGTSKGKPLPTGTYYYLINLNDGTKPISGYLVIIR